MSHNLILGIHSCFVPCNMFVMFCVVHYDTKCHESLQFISCLLILEQQQHRRYAGDILIFNMAKQKCSVWLQYTAFLYVFLKHSFLCNTKLRSLSHEPHGEVKLCTKINLYLELNIYMHIVQRIQLCEYFIHSYCKTSTQ